ncbi:hypothetical protein [Priestia megaterium]|uniref:hypothetical protein n=1 Tax=Priestia megaterium TaxID=1404 RepID=UPI002E1A169E|nr:hypothetical protein [Priestia megaterium]
MSNILLSFFLGILSSFAFEIIKPEIVGLKNVIRQNPFKTTVLLLLLTIVVLLMKLVA